MAKKTNEEIQSLKDGWRKDPCWDIEDTEGFEEHYDELLAYRRQVEFEAEKIRKDQIMRRRNAVGAETGVIKNLVADEIWTFSEIEWSVKSQDRNIANASSNEKNAHLELLQAQVRATLLLAAQVQRVADFLVTHFDQEEAENQQEFMKRLYKVE